MNELNWLTQQRPDVDEDPFARAQARRALLEQTRPRSRSRVPRRAGVLATAGLVAAAMAVAWPTGGPDVPAPFLAPPEAAQAAPLVLLSDKVAAQPAPAGDATLIERSHGFSDSERNFAGLDLYLDDGRYFYGASSAELRGAALETDSGGQLLEAARTADRDKMIAATFAGNPVPTLGRVEQLNRVWMGSMEALLAGAGRPEVRAGVLRLLATMPAVEVKRTANALTITQSDFPNDYEEALVVNAETGVPVRFTGGTAGEAPDVTVNYEIKRVTAANWVQAAR